MRQLMHEQYASIIAAQESYFESEVTVMEFQMMNGNIVCHRLFIEIKRVMLITKENSKEVYFKVKMLELMFKTSDNFLMIKTYK